MNSHSLRTTTQTALTGLVLTASLLAQGAGSSSIRINEVVYDDEGNDDREFVELFNGGASPVDLGGFLIQIDTPGGALPPYPIPSGTVIDPRGFVVLGGANAMHLTVPLVSPQTGGDLFPDGPATMILIDPLGQPIDAFAYQTGSAQWPTAHLEGDGFVGSLQSLDNLPLSIQRIFDGHDTDRNGRDFVVQEQTPGESNNRSTFSPVTRFDLLGREIGSQLLPVEMLGINSIQPLIVDPQLPPTPGLPTLLQPVPPSPFGPNVLALGDPMFAGPQSTSYVIPQQQASRFIVESYVYIDPQPMPQGGFEGFALGVGSTSEFRLQEQGDPLGISQQNGNTGASLIYRSTEFGNELLIVDHNDGGFGPQAQSPEQVVAAFPVDPAMFGGWQRVRFEVLPECIFVRVGGTVGQDDGIEFSVFHDGSPLLVYAGYETNGLGARRPLLLDGLTIRGPKSMDIGLQEVPYVQGASIGPLTSPVDPGREAEEKVYAQAYWTAHDSSGADTAALQAFQFSQGVTDAPGAYSCDEDPFVQGYQLFREIYSHRLQLDPRFPLYDLDDLIRDDEWVELFWRHWTTTHQLITVSVVDQQAHFNHLLALYDAILAGAQQWTTRGVPLLDGVILCSEGTSKKGSGTATQPPSPTNVTTLVAKLQQMHTKVQNSAGVLMVPNLYDADGSWWFSHIGFDCDDFADALAVYTANMMAGAKACTVRVTWTKGNGKGAAHRVTKVKFCGYYWLMDAQGGVIDGPFRNGTPHDARRILGGYDIDAGKPVETEQGERRPGERPSLREPKAWHHSDAQRMRFQMLTGRDPAGFTPR